MYTQRTISGRNRNRTHIGFEYLFSFPLFVLFLHVRMTACLHVRMLALSLVCFLHVRTFCFLSPSHRESERGEEQPTMGGISCPLPPPHPAPIPSPPPLHPRRLPIPPHDTAVVTIRCAHHEAAQCSMMSEN
jgi:hypothetical protein